MAPAATYVSGHLPPLPKPTEIAGWESGISNNNSGAHGVEGPSVGQLACNLTVADAVGFRCQAPAGAKDKNIRRAAEHISSDVASNSCQNL